MDRLGQLIRARRRAKGLSLGALAERVGCAKGYLSLIENDRRRGAPSRALLRRLERALAMPEGALVVVGAVEASPVEARALLESLWREREMGRRLAALVRVGDGAHLEASELAAAIDDGTSPDVGALAFAAAPLLNVPGGVYPRVEGRGIDGRVEHGWRGVAGYVSAPHRGMGDAFALWVVGAAMAPAFREGDVVVFGPPAGRGPAAPDGADCLVTLDDGRPPVLRRVFASGGAGRVRLQPLDWSEAPAVVERERVVSVCPAVLVIRPVAGGSAWTVGRGGSAGGSVA